MTERDRVELDLDDLPDELTVDFVRGLDSRDCIRIEEAIERGDLTERQRASYKAAMREILGPGVRALEAWSEQTRQQFAPLSKLGEELLAQTAGVRKFGDQISRLLTPKSAVMAKHLGLVVGDAPTLAERLSRTVAEPLPVPRFVPPPSSELSEAEVAERDAARERERRRDELMEALVAHSSATEQYVRQLTAIHVQQAQEASRQQWAYWLVGVVAFGSGEAAVLALFGGSWQGWYGWVSSIVGVVFAAVLWFVMFGTPADPDGS